MYQATRLLLIGVFLVPRAAHAQACVPPEHPYFEFQVQQPAKFIGDTSVRPRPRIVERALAVQNADPSSQVVAFVVDSLGAPQAVTLKILKSPSREASVAVSAAITTWKFSPAMLAGCRVPQLVMVEVEP